MIIKLVTIPKLMPGHWLIIKDHLPMCPKKCALQPGKKVRVLRVGPNLGISIESREYEMWSPAHFARVDGGALHATHEYDDVLRYNINEAYGVDWNFNPHGEIAEEDDADA